MYFFDNDYLGQYLNIGKDIKVTVDNKILTMSSMSDVEDSSQGVGTDENGNVDMFDYTDIEQIQVGPNIITLELLQKIMGNEKQPETPPKPVKKSEPAEEEPAPEEEEPPAKEKSVEKASFDIYNLGRLLIKESRKR